jgi:hypothetical protein
MPNAGGQVSQEGDVPAAEGEANGGGVYLIDGGEEAFGGRGGEGGVGEQAVRKGQIVGSRTAISQNAVCFVLGDGIAAGRLPCLNLRKCN